MKQMQENNRRYYEQQLDKELDDMEKDLKSGNIIGAMYDQIFMIPTSGYLI